MNALLGDILGFAADWMREPESQGRTVEFQPS